jgi:hypothetical protein
MKTGVRPFLRQSISLAAAGVLVVVLAACTGRGGGYLPPNRPVFTGQASFGFTFSCEDKGGLNPPTGQLRIELAYNERGTYTYVDGSVIGSPFSIHGIVDTIRPGLEWVESAICIGQKPPPGGNELIFLGRYRLTTSAPAGFPTTCRTRETKTTPLCRFEVEVHDNDRDLAPSKGDFFSIKLSTATETVTEDCPDPKVTECLVTELPAGTVFYTRFGYLEGGNLTVD